MELAIDIIQTFPAVEHAPDQRFAGSGSVDADLGKHHRPSIAESLDASTRLLSAAEAPTKGQRSPTAVSFGRSQRAEKKRVAAAISPLNPALSLLRSPSEEIAILEAKIEEAKTQLESQLYVLRTQISRIEELERVVETANNELHGAKRRREGEIAEMESMRRQLQAQLDKICAENKIAEGQLLAAQKKNESMGRVIKGQVSSLAETFSPQWTGKDVKALVLATARAEADSAGFCAFSSEISPEDEAAAVQSVFDLRSPEERMQEVVEWKKRKDDALRTTLEFLVCREESLRREVADDREYEIMQMRLDMLAEVYFGVKAAPSFKQPTVPPSPPRTAQQRLRQRYASSACESVRRLAESVCSPQH